MRTTFLLSLLLGLLAPSGLTGQTPKNCYRADPGAGARDHKLDYQKMELDVSFEPSAGVVNGTVTHTFKPLRGDVDSFFLDGPGIQFQQVQLGQKPVPYRVQPDGIWIRPDRALDPGATYHLQITYSAQPRKGLYFIGWDQPDTGSRQQIWTQGQGTDNRHWIPCYDNPNDKLVTSVRVTFDSAFKVLSNGRQVSVESNPAEGTKTWHYQTTHRHTTYLVMLAIGHYNIEKRETRNEVPLYLYYYPDEPEKVKPTYQHSKEIMNFLEQEMGVAYPWSRYSQVPVQDFLYGAMENTTATIFGDFYYGNKRQQLDRDYTYVNAHELVHHWFGDYVTLNSDEHAWLHESFATHYGRLAERHLYGQQYYQRIREQQLQRALSAAEKNTRPIQHTQAGTNRIYPKGALVLGMLKDVVGMEAFDRVVTHFLKKHAYSNVTTHDFYMAFQEVLGRNLDWFFDQWIKRGGVPHYRINYQVSEASKLLIQVEQIHETNDLVGYFRMPVELEVHFRDGSRQTLRNAVRGASTTLSITKPEDKKIAYILFDPENRIVKRETFEQPVKVLKAKAMKAPYMIARYDAVKKLRSKASTAKLEALRAIYTSADHHLVRQEALKQLTQYPAEEVIPLLRKGLTADHHEVRRVVLKQLDDIPRPLIPLYEKSLKDSSFRNIELALRQLVEHQPRNLGTYLTTTKGIKGLDNHNVRLTWLELVAAYKSQSYTEQLVPYASGNYEFRTRVKAMKALKKLNHCSKVVIQHLADAYLNPNGRLSRPARKVLKYFYQQQQYQVMIEQYYQTNTWPDFAEEKWQELLEA